MRKIILLLLLIITIQSSAQTITGVIVSAETGDSIAFPSLRYKKAGVTQKGNATGQFTIKRINGAYLTISAMGYKTLKILIGANTPNTMRITLKEDMRRLEEVTIKSQRGKYSRKENPAVELMKRVIAAKKHTDLSNHDYYKYDKYISLKI